MAEVTRYVDPDVVGGLGDGTSWANAYSSLNGWEAAEETDLVTDTDTHVVHCRATGTVDSTVIDVTGGWVANGTYFITIINDDDHEGELDTSIYHLAASSQWGAALSLGVDYTVVDGLQIANTYSTNGIGFNITCDNGVFKDLIIYSGYASLFRDSSGTNNILVNCLLYNSGGGDGVYKNADGGSLYVYYCTIVDSFDDGVYCGSGRTVYLKNCYVGGCSGADLYEQGTGTIDITTSYTEDGSLSTTTAAYSISAGCYFINITPGSEDLSIGSSSTLIGNGTDLSSDGFYQVAVDILGNARHATTPDIGAFEYLATGGTTYYQNTGQGALTPTGSLNKKTTPVTAMGGYAINITGVLGKKTSKFIGNHTMSIVGVLGKKTSKFMGNHAMSIAGNLNKKTTPVTAMGGHALSIIGTLNKKTTPVTAMGGYVVSIVGILSKKTSKYPGGYAMNIAGSLNKKTTPVTAMGGYVINIIGTLNKKTTPVTAMGGHATTIIGSLTKSIVITQDTGNHAMTITGALTTVVTFIKSVGSYAMTILGTLVKKTSKSVGSGQVEPTGTLSKKTSKDVGSGSVTSIGTLAVAIMYTQAVGGASMSMIGSLATQFIAGTGAVIDFIRRRKTFYKQ